MPQERASSPTTEGWENEGGSLRPAVGAEPSGITRILVESFRVGGYTYTNLADAEAQARRMSETGTSL